jgi:3-oxoacyl-[acyl-carrier-protein] synthase II
MSRRVVITGLGPVSGLGLGIEPTWQQVTAGASAIAPIEAFDASQFDSRIAAEVRDFKVRDYVPKSYRKATKVMARDIELAVAAADLAARDAGLATQGTAPDSAPDYPPDRCGAHIGAGLIAVDLDELTAALAEAKEEGGGESFSLHKWGAEGMSQLTPLWLLKYLPNMLACHVTIIHGAHGPSNTITCGEASSGLSIGESLRVIQRNGADLCFCGGTESKLNLMAFLRQQFTERLATDGNDAPTQAVRPFDQQAGGTVVGEGGGIVTLESWDSFEQRRQHQPEARAYAELAGFGASQSVNREAGNLKPEPDGRGIAVAIRAALREAGVDTDQIDLVMPFGSGVPAWDHAEAAAMRAVFGDRLADLPVVSTKPLAGNTGAGAGSLDVALAAKALAEQTVPPVLNRDAPLDGLGNGPTEAQSAQLTHALVFSAGFGGQNTALVLRKA